MKRLLHLLTVTALLAGCGPTKVSDEASNQCYAYDLEVIPNDGQLTVQWKSNCGRIISGYNIYVQTQPVLSRSTSNPHTQLKPHNQSVYPGDTNPDDEWITYEALGLENGVKYWVSVCAVYSDRTISKPTEELLTACGPRGEFELAVRYTGDNDGYSFSEARFVEADELANDLYYFNQNGSDYLDAPTRLDGFLRKTQLAKLDVKGDLTRAMAFAIDKNVVPSGDRLAVKKGDWLLIKTADQNFVLVNVLDFAGSGENRRIKLFYAFSSIPNQIVL